MLKSSIRHLSSPEKEAPVTLLCFAHAGGGTSRYRSWYPELAGLVDLLIPVLPGREDRFLEPAFPSLEKTADEVMAALAPYRHKPLAVAGISYGALLAYEVSVRLNDWGTEVKALFAASQRAPTNVRQPRHWYEMPDEDLVDCLVQLEGFDADTLSDPEFRELFLPTIRADLEASDRYRPTHKPTLKCPIHVWRGANDAVISEADTLDWAQATNDTSEYRTFNSGHFLFDGNRDLFLDAIKKVLASLSITESA